MQKPYNKYCYDDCICDYAGWVAECVAHPDKVFLRQQDVIKLEHLYDDDVLYTEVQHQKNIRFLEDLLLKIDYVLTWSQRKKANMGSLVEDYKHYFGLEDAT